VRDPDIFWGIAVGRSHSLDARTIIKCRRLARVYDRQSGCRWLSASSREQNNGVDPLLLYSVMHQESSFKSHAVSPKGSAWIDAADAGGPAMRYGVTNIFDPRQNIEGGARYLRFLLESFLMAM